MIDKLMLFAADADRWEKTGMPLQEEDALIIALWRWFRGRPDPRLLPYGAALIYGDMTERLSANEKRHEDKVRAGRAGGIKTQTRNRYAKASAQADAKADNQTSLLKPSTPTPTPSTSFHEDKGNTPCTRVPVDELMKLEKSDCKAARFTNPTADEVRSYCSEQGITNVDAGQFVDYYDGNGWMVGKVKMKDWKATIRNWSRRHSQSGRRNASPVGLFLKDSNAKDYDEEL